jgi:hypothetical protein
MLIKNEILNLEVDRGFYMSFNRASFRICYCRGDSEQHRIESNLIEAWILDP